MTGTGHIRSGLCIGIIASSVIQILIKHNKIPMQIIDYVYSAMIASIPQCEPLSIMACLIAYILGLLLPDIDNRKSRLGKKVHLNIKHRTWTHTIWMVAACAASSLLLRGVGFFLASGVFTHILIDSFSRRGVKWFYPIGKRKNISKHLVLYRDLRSENVFNVVLSLATIMILAVNVFIVLA